MSEVGRGARHAGPWHGCVLHDADRRADAVPTSRTAAFTGTGDAQLAQADGAKRSAGAAALDRAYAVGDHRTARALASRLLALPDAALAARARAILAYTAPDPFLAWVGAAGLGLVGWLVYNFMS